VLTAALVGYLGGRWAPEMFGAGGHGAANKSFGPALIDDHTPPPDHARFTWLGLASLGATGVVLWALPMAVLTALFGWGGTLTQMSWFFTKAALLTFGGAYAVLPYVYQGAVGHYGWLTPTQMIDGLALGETTPGPLIMVVAYVGFIGAYVLHVFGPEHAFLAGAVAAALVTWFTFLPSFLFILAGGPLVESTHNQLAFTAPLTAITAAVVGVILNLACFFGYHVLWPNGFSAGLDWPCSGRPVLLQARRDPGVAGMRRCRAVCPPAALTPSRLKLVLQQRRVYLVGPALAGNAVGGTLQN
jgi:chromate transporter